MTGYIKLSFSLVKLLWSYKIHEKQRSSQRKCKEHFSNLPSVTLRGGSRVHSSLQTATPSHHDNATHQGIFISQPCYEVKCMEWTWTWCNLSWVRPWFIIHYSSVCFVHCPGSQCLSEQSIHNSILSWQSNPGPDHSWHIPLKVAFSVCLSTWQLNPLSRPDLTSWGQGD